MCTLISLMVAWVLVAIEVGSTEALPTTETQNHFESTCVPDDSCDEDLLMPLWIP